MNKAPPARIKVAVLLPSLEVGGAEKLVLEELHELRKDARFQIELHLLFSPGPLFEDFAELQIPIIVWKAKHAPLSMLLAYARFAAYLFRNRFDVLHCHLLYLLGPWTGVVAGVKNIIVTVHTKAAMNRAEIWALARCQRVLACGSQVAEHLKAIRKSLRVEVLNNAIRMRKVVAVPLTEFQHKYDLNGVGQVVLTLGRLIADKGYDVLIRSFREIVDTMPEVALLIAGEGEERARLGKLIETQGLQKQVRLLGNVRDVDSLLAQADVYVNTSWREGLSISVLEAMMHGKAIVATSVGGNKDLIENQRSGLLVEPGATDQITQALLRLLTDQDLRHNYGEAARERFVRDFDVQEHCSKLARIYMATANTTQPTA